MARAYRTQGMHPVEYPVGQWKGLLDTVQPNAAKGNWLTSAYNVWIRDVELVGTLVDGRPGFQLLGAQLGETSKRTVQRIVQFTKASGVSTTIAVVGGHVYSLNWATRAWTEELTPAQITAGGATLSQTVRVYAVTYTDKLILSDGVNLPFAWDGTTGAGITNLSNAAVFYGQPWVYYAKLFGIKNTDRVTIVWSEEGTPNTGYEAGGYNNAWTIRQTSQDPLVAAAAFNDFFLLFRAYSITPISGAVTTDFKAQGVREGVSETIGTSSPAGVWVEDDQAYFLGSDRRLYRVGRGEKPTEVAVGARQALRAISVSGLANALVAPWTLGQAVCFGIVGTGYTAPSFVVAVDVHRGACLGIWNGWLMTAWDEVTDADGQPVLLHGGGASSSTSADGYVYDHGHPDGSLWQDGFQGGNSPISHEAGFTVGWTPKGVKRFDRLDAGMLLDTNLTGLTVHWQTPGTTNSGSVVGTITASGYVYDDPSSQYDTATYAGTAAERAMPVGLAAEGRWMNCRLAHGLGVERFRLTGAVVSGMLVDPRPGVY